MKQDDAAYYRKRATQEQVAAQNAKCEAARDRHEELAVMYRFRSAMATVAPVDASDCSMDAKVIELA